MVGPPLVSFPLVTRRRLLALGAGVLVHAPRRARALTVTDMLGRPVVLPAAPQRLVSLVPSATEMLFALGADARLVGVTDYCDHPPAARRKPSVGGMLAPAMETILSLRPDLVIATDAGFRRETFAQMERLGLPVYLVRASRLADVFDVAARLGDLTGRAEAARALAAGLERRLDGVRRTVQGRPRPRVLYVLWADPLVVPGRGALVTELIALAGGDSVSASEPGEYPRLGLEAAIARAPEVIVLAQHGGRTEPIAMARWERLDVLPAVRAGRVHAADGDLLHRYGPRVVVGVEILARLFHPEAPR